jgi:peptide/nickel transport system permease protein
LAQAPAVSLAPGLGVALVSLAFSFVGDGLRDMLDPRWQTSSS